MCTAYKHLHENPEENLTYHGEKQAEWQGPKIKN